MTTADGGVHVVLYLSQLREGISKMIFTTFNLTNPIVISACAPSRCFEHNQTVRCPSMQR